jgi:hypothetical protein
MTTVRKGGEAEGLEAGALEIHFERLNLERLQDGIAGAGVGSAELQQGFGAATPARAS